eukprot:SAG11_NODE_13_length_26388_cov_67.360341_22_plen_311_part_00
MLINQATRCRFFPPSLKLRKREPKTAHADECNKIMYCGFQSYLECMDHPVLSHFSATVVYLLPIRGFFAPDALVAAVCQGGCDKEDAISSSQQRRSGGSARKCNVGVRTGARPCPPDYVASTTQLQSHVLADPRLKRNRASTVVHSRARRLLRATVRPPRRISSLLWVHAELNLPRRSTRACKTHSGLMKILCSDGNYCIAGRKGWVVMVIIALRGEKRFGSSRSVKPAFDASADLIQKRLALPLRLEVAAHDAKRKPRFLIAHGEGWYDRVERTLSYKPPQSDMKVPYILEHAEARCEKTGSDGALPGA